MCNHQEMSRIDQINPEPQCKTALSYLNACSDPAVVHATADIGAAGILPKQVGRPTSSQPQDCALHRYHTIHNNKRRFVRNSKNPSKNNFAMDEASAPLRAILTPNETKKPNTVGRIALKRHMGFNWCALPKPERAMKEKHSNKISQDQE